MVCTIAAAELRRALVVGRVLLMPKCSFRAPEPVHCSTAVTTSRRDPVARVILLSHAGLSRSLGSTE